MNQKEKEHLSETGHTLLLLLASLIWGAAFVAQSIGAEYVGAYTDWLRQRSPDAHPVGRAVEQKIRPPYSQGVFRLRISAMRMAEKMK